MRKIIILLALICLFWIVPVQAGPVFFWSDSEQNMAMAQDALMKINYYATGITAAIFVLDIELAWELTDWVEEELDVYDFYITRVRLTIPMYGQFSSMEERLVSLRNSIARLRASIE